MIILMWNHLSVYVLIWLVFEMNSCILMGILNTKMIGITSTLVGIKKISNEQIDITVCLQVKPSQKPNRKLMFFIATTICLFWSLSYSVIANLCISKSNSTSTPKSKFRRTNRHINSLNMPLRTPVFNYAPKCGFNRPETFMLWLIRTNNE